MVSKLQDCIQNNTRILQIYTFVHQGLLCYAIGI
jgi:hypothetical protein